jgi:hypothetical protein
MGSDGKYRMSCGFRGSGKGLTAVTLQFGWRTAPVSRINVRNGLRETPMVHGEVLNIILSFAIRIVRGFPNNQDFHFPPVGLLR